MTKKNYYNVGILLNTQGLQGEMRVLPVTDFSNKRFVKGTVLALFDEEDQYVQDLVIGTARPYKKIYIVKFIGLDHINKVEKFKNFTLKIAEENLGTLEKGEFYYHEIIGLNVYENGREIGVISEILQPGANDVWVVKRSGKKDLLLPYIDSVIRKINITAKKIEVEIPEGLDDEI